MNVAELIAKLQTLPQDAEVVLTTPGVSNDLVRMAGLYRVEAEGVVYVALGLGPDAVDLQEEPDSGAFVEIR